MTLHIVFRFTVELKQCTVYSSKNSRALFGVSGTLNLSTSDSRVMLKHVTLEGQSKIGDSGGSIIFDGSIAQGGTPTISDDGCSIDVTLPTNASFHLDLNGILGPIASNFPGVRNTGPNMTDLHVNVGSNPSAVKLTLDLNDTFVVLSGR